MTRISELLRLIPEYESLLERTPRKDVEKYARYKMQIEQLKLEYKERTRRVYHPPRRPQTGSESSCVIFDDDGRQRL